MYALETHMSIFYLDIHWQKKRLLEEIVASGDNSIKIIPLYVLCYLFDTNE